VAKLLIGDLVGVRNAYLDTLAALRTRAIPTISVASRVRLTKSPARYALSREQRREFTYEALLASGRTTWNVGERAHVYRRQQGGGGVVEAFDGESLVGAQDARDYDVDYYARLLLRTFAARLVRAFAPLDFAAVFADPEQLSLFAPDIADMHTVLHTRAGRP
jgi:hypothetical protein